MPAFTIQAHLAQINPDHVSDTYNGLDGCACGCGGTYAADGAAATRRIRTINKAIEDGTLTLVQINHDGTIIYEHRTGQDRVTRVYVTADLDDAKAEKALREMTA
ncbi:MAG: hypothetical protein MUF33_02170 [Candidatus Nanopelagicales bacterium]|jgi:hypothetical protein|nr:hypothetical protein [Candidatus Nanopelagicales bacterium]